MVVQQRYQTARASKEVLREALKCGVESSEKFAYGAREGRRRREGRLCLMKCVEGPAYISDFPTEFIIPEFAFSHNE